MIIFSPRFFVLPLIALTVILSLPRPAQDACRAAAAPALAAPANPAEATQASCKREAERPVTAPAKALAR